MRTTFLGEIVAVKNVQYPLYVFKNLDEPQNSLLRYFTVTKLPNWCICNLDIGDVGYVECEYVNAGDTYISREGSLETYNYTNCYLLNFIKKEETDLIKTKEFNF